MNIVSLTGRLTKDPTITYTTDQKAVARFTLAVQRRFSKDQADFISCVCFGKAAEFMEKYFSKGMKAEVTGSIQTGSYKNKDGQMVYTTDVIADSVDFAESKGSTAETSKPTNENTEGGFMNIPDGIDEELPFN